MTKKVLAPQTLLAPVPAALISCGTEAGEQNIITLAWVGVVNSIPPMISISIRPSRHSHQIIKESEEFVINIPSSEQVDLVDGCGTVSGKAVDKFSHFQLTANKGVSTYAPFIEECPINLECRLKQVLSLGSHDLFIGEIVNVLVDEHYLDSKGKLDFKTGSILGFAGGQYLTISPTGVNIGDTVRKKG
jgi:flavin reductase (DIM6/NTAB) family NADH-FMN oxidoreductase RutF